MVADKPAKNRGNPIPNSRLYRDYCAGCQEPIRVGPDGLNKPQVWCVHCAPGMALRGHPGYGRDDEDANGCWAGVVRAYEDEG